MSLTWTPNYRIVEYPQLALLSLGSVAVYQDSEDLYKVRANIDHPEFSGRRRPTRVGYDGIVALLEAVKPAMIVVDEAVMEGLRTAWQPRLAAKKPKVKSAP